MDSRLVLSHNRLKAVCNTAGIDHSDAEPIRVASTAVWRAGGCVVKIYEPGDTTGPNRALAVGRWLAETGIPAVRPYLPEVVSVESVRATFWHDLGEHRRATGHEMGTVLRRLHAEKVPAWLPVLSDPMRNVRWYLEGAAWASQADIDAIASIADDMRTAWAVLVDKTYLTVTHGDAWPGNFAATSDGNVAMLDLEGVAAAPKARDLGKFAAKTFSMGQFQTEDYREFVQAYGHDVGLDSDYPVYRRIEEVTSCAYALFTAQNNPAARPYAQHRTDCVLGRKERPWEPWVGLPVDFRPDAEDEAAA